MFFGHGKGNIPANNNKEKKEKTDSPIQSNAYNTTNE